jgi:hypothetical protein
MAAIGCHAALKRPEGVLVGRADDQAHPVALNKRAKLLQAPIEAPAIIPRHVRAETH